MLETSKYVVTAYRWGMRDAHSYVVGCFDTLKDAKASAKLHIMWRGGKYSVEVIRCSGKMNEGGENYKKQTFYLETPYFGMANQNRTACQPAKHGKLGEWAKKLVKSK